MGLLDDDNIKQMTEDFLSFKGFDLGTDTGVKKAIKWLEQADGNDMFYRESSGIPEEDAFDSMVGEMRRSTMLEYLKRKKRPEKK